MNRKPISLHRIISWALILCMMLGMSTTVFAAQVEDVNTDGKINYVSIGASNANGYGMRGYLPNDYDDNGLPVWDNNVYEVPVLKAGLNIYGYQQQVNNSYPDLIADDLEAIFGVGNVERNELAMSSMRAEEVRFLIQDENDPNAYPVDPYIRWRFYDTTGFNPSLDDNWFYFAGRQEHNRRNPGDELPMPDASAQPAFSNVTEEHFEKALSALRLAYQEYIATADLITLDIGMNNFGVYLGHEIGSNSYYGHDLSTIDPAIAAVYDEGKAFVMQLLNENFAAELENVPMDLFTEIIDVLAYALVSYCTNFDIIVERIRELNPDAMIVAVSVQNIMADLSTTLPGMSITVPYGDMLGAVINAANIYIAGLSANSNEYLFADVMAGGHVEFFLDEIGNYNGNPATISQNIRDSFDIYDTDLLLKFYIRKEFTSLLSTMIEVEGFDPADSITTYLGKLFGQQISVAGTPLINLFFAREDQLPEDYRPIRAIYDRMLETAYDAMAQIMQEGAQIEAIDLFTVMGNGVSNGTFRNDFRNVAVKAAYAAAADPAYKFDASVEFPNGIFNTLAATHDNIDAFRYASCAVNYIRTGIGNSFYGHPSEYGQYEIYEAITAAIEKEITGSSIFNEIMGDLSEELIALYHQKLYDATHLAYPICTPIHNYVALGGIVTAGDGLKDVPNYADLFAGAFRASGVEVNYTNLGVSSKDTDKTFDELNTQNVAAYIEANRAAIADADLITYNMDSTALMSVIFDILGGEAVDWETYLNEMEKEIVKTVIAKLYTSIIEEGSEMPMVNEATVESVAYVMVRFCIESMRALEAIAEINPAAEIIVIGMYNPFEGMVIDMAGESIDIGTLFEYVIEASDLYYSLHALFGNVTFVAAPDAEVVGVGTISIGENASLGTLALKLRSISKKMLATEAGQQYIADRLLEAVTFTEEHRFERVAYTAPEVGVPGSETLECVKCGEIKITNIPALEEEPEPDVPDTPVIPDEPDTPVVPDEPEVPDTPVIPDPPVIPDNPYIPPLEPDEPDVPDTPVVPSTPADPEPYTCDGGEDCPMAAFEDLDPTAWYHLGVDVMLNEGIMKGVSEAKFAPTAEITRAELVTMLWRLEGSPATESTLTFEDVASDSWYADAVRWAVANGITNGISETQFAPAAVITREQIAVMLARYAEYKGNDIATEHTLTAFTDAAETSDWALDAMEWANETGLLQGTTDTTISPKTSGTRAQVAVILYRMDKMDN